MKIENFKLKIIFISILLLAAFFRFYGINWDQNQHLHPDERFLTMVATGISWPKNVAEYLDTANSPLNPHNRGFGFFVYGTFPIFFTKWIAESFQMGDYTNLTLIGRQLSAFVDLATVLLVYLIARKIGESRTKKPTTIFPLLAMFFYAISVLPIQLSHFFAVDAYLTFFIVLSFYILVIITQSSRHPKLNNHVLLLLHAVLGISFGLAASSKISAFLFIPIIALIYILYFKKVRHIVLFLLHISVFLLCFYFVFRIFYPYAFASNNIFDPSLNPKVVDNWKQLKSFNDVTGGFPPAVQWITTKAYIFPAKNIIFWGLGVPLSLLVIISIFYTSAVFIKQISRKNFSFIGDPKFLIFVWILLLFGYQGKQFVKAMRYFYLLYPFFALSAASLLITFHLWMQKRVSVNYQRIFYSFGLILLLVYPFSFLSIYSHLHSRVAASKWIYQHIPAGSVLSGEHWDDYLPISTTEYIKEIYSYIEFPLYAADNQLKWEEMDKKLKQVDYIILTSNRLYGAIMTMPTKWPITTTFYQMLFDGSLGFQKVAEFTSRPNVSIPGITVCLTPPFIRYGVVAYKTQQCPLEGIHFVDDYADESFTVYDHPKVIIFKKIKQVNYLDLLYSSNAQ